MIFQQDDLGSAEIVQQKKVESDKWVFIEGCKNPRSVTVLIRGGSQRVVDEVDRSLHDALMVVKDVVEKTINCGWWWFTGSISSCGIK